MTIISITYTFSFFFSLQLKKYFCKCMRKKNQLKRFRMVACTTLSSLYTVLSIYAPTALCRAYFTIIFQDQRIFMSLFSLVQEKEWNKKLQDCFKKLLIVFFNLQYIKL